jgi:hypothetical protein
MPRHLIYAYVATWLVHGVYFVHLWRKWIKTRRQ